MFPIVIRIEANNKVAAQLTAMHLKDSMAQLAVIPQSGVTTQVQLEFRNGKRVGHLTTL
jgi:hypothetical protein